MTHKSEDFKISAAEYYLTSDKNQLEICEIFNCSARSLMRWVAKYCLSLSSTPTCRVMFTIDSACPVFAPDSILFDTFTPTRFCGRFTASFETSTSAKPLSFVYKPPATFSSYSTRCQFVNSAKRVTLVWSVHYASWHLKSSW